VPTGIQRVTGNRVKLWVRIIFVRLVVVVLLYDWGELLQFLLLLLLILLHSEQETPSGFLAHCKLLLSRERWGGELLMWNRLLLLWLMWRCRECGTNTKTGAAAATTAAAEIVDADIAPVADLYLTPPIAVILN
jgi:hypothetical protein